LPNASAAPRLRAGRPWQAIALPNGEGDVVSAALSLPSGGRKHQRAIDAAKGKGIADADPSRNRLGRVGHAIDRVHGWVRLEEIDRGRRDALVQSLDRDDGFDRTG